MNFDELIKHLNNNHFYPVDVEKTIRKNSTEITALHIQSNPFIAENKLRKLNFVLEGTGYNAQKMSNKDYLVITKNK